MERSARSQAARGKAARSGTPGDRSILAGAVRNVSKTSVPGRAVNGPAVKGRAADPGGSTGAATTTVPARPQSRVRMNVQSS